MNRNIDKQCKLTIEKFNSNKEFIAFILYLLGIKPFASSFEELPTLGYGEMDEFGFFEYPLLFKTH